MNKLQANDIGNSCEGQCTQVDSKLQPRELLMKSWHFLFSSSDPSNIESNVILLLFFFSSVNRHCALIPQISAKLQFLATER